MFCHQSKSLSQSLEMMQCIRELEDTLLMWHGPDPDPERAAELEKRIFGPASP